MAAEVDLITSSRTAQPRLAAIYLVMPTSDNVQRILLDYNNAPAPAQQHKHKKGQPQQQQMVEPPKYQAAHVNFIDGQPPLARLAAHDAHRR